MSHRGIQSSGPRKAASEVLDVMLGKPGTPDPHSRYADDPAIPLAERDPALAEAILEPDDTQKDGA